MRRLQWTRGLGQDLSCHRNATPSQRPGPSFWTNPRTPASVSTFKCTPAAHRRKCSAFSSSCSSPIPQCYRLRGGGSADSSATKTRENRVERERLQRTARVSAGRGRVCKVHSRWIFTHHHHHHWDQTPLFDSKKSSNRHVAANTRILAILTFDCMLYHLWFVSFLP